VVDGTDPWGSVIKWGPTNLYNAPPTVAPDPNRHSITTDIASPTNFVNEFFNSKSSPQGHGFNRANTGSLAACYTFEPLTNMPIKVIVLDDTCKSNRLAQNPTFYGGGWVDALRYNWLTKELQKGQDADQLMIIATHKKGNWVASKYLTIVASLFLPDFAPARPQGMRKPLPSGKPVACHSLVWFAVSELPFGGLKTRTRISTTLSGLGGSTCALMSVELGGSRFTTIVQGSPVLGATVM
jgi:hypothetical protein